MQFERRYLGLAVPAFIAALITLLALTDFAVLDFKTIDETQLLKAFGGLILFALIIERATEVYINREGQTADTDQRVTLNDMECATKMLEVAEVELEEVLADPAATAAQKNAARKVVSEAKKKRNECLKNALPVQSVLKTNTQKRAMMVAMILGLFAAMAGIRALSPFIDLGSCAPLAMSAPVLEALNAVMADGKQIAEADWTSAKEALMGDANLRCTEAADQRAFLAAIDVVITAALLAGGADGLHQIVNRFLKWQKSPVT